MTSTKFLNSFLVLGLVVAVALFLGVASPAFADHNEDPVPTFDPETGDLDGEDARLEARARIREHTGDNKILFPALVAGQVVDQYIVEGSDSPTWTDMGTPNGLYAGSQVAPIDGTPLTFFAPTSDTAEGPGTKVSNFFAWSETDGWELLSSVIAMPSSSDTEL